MTDENMKGPVDGLDDMEHCMGCGLSWHRLDRDRRCPKCAGSMPQKVEAKINPECSCCLSLVSEIANLREIGSASEAASNVLRDEIAWLRELVERMPGLQSHRVRCGDREVTIGGARGDVLTAGGFPDGITRAWDGEKWMPPIEL
jgi:hypothetical protein